MICKHCGIETPRLTLRQEHCPDCARRVAAIEAADAKRRTPRFGVAKSLDRWSPA